VKLEKIGFDCYWKDLLEYDDESSIDRLQRALRELEKRVDRYFEDLGEIEKMCKQAHADVKRFQLKAKVEKNSEERDAEIQDKLFSAVKGMLCFKASIYALVGRISVFVDECWCYIDFKVILPTNLLEKKS